MTAPKFIVEKSPISFDYYICIFVRATEKYGHMCPVYEVLPGRFKTQQDAEEFIRKEIK